MRLGIDIGAGSTKIVAIDRRNTVHGRIRLSSNSPGIHELLDRIAVACRRLGRFTSVGVGFCGMVDADRGVVLATTDTFPEVSFFPLADELSSRLSAEVKMDNDGNCAALAEATLGSGRGAPSVAMFVLGTGLGGGLVLDGRPVRGAGFAGGKLGHIQVRRGGRRCACGAKGCLEAYCSAWAFERASGMSPPELFSAARRGDVRAARCVREAGEALGIAMAIVANTVNPAVMVVGGGMGPGFASLIAHALPRFERSALAEARHSTRIARSMLGREAGAIGASLL